LSRIFSTGVSDLPPGAVACFVHFGALIAAFLATRILWQIRGAEKRKED
jgi:hypothetical protein